MFSAISFSKLHRACRSVWTLVWLQPLQKWMHWCCLGCVQLSLRIFWRFWAERFLFVPLSFLDLMFEFLMNVAKVLVSLFISVAKNLINNPSVSSAIILCFSIAVKRPFIGILRDLQESDGKWKFLENANNRLTS